MKNSISFLVISLFTLVFLPVTEQLLARETATPTADVSEMTDKKPKIDQELSSTIVIHKPTTDPAWGKVIQYQSEISALNHEVLHKFLFQDSKGIVRNATYHENTSENGYWEVWVWDQP